MATRKRVEVASVVEAKRFSIPKINYSVVLVVLLVAASFLVGRLSAQVEYLKSGGVATKQPDSQAAAQPVQAQQAKPNVTMEQVRALFDGKNITFGDKNSKLVFVEFSDPSCPYCHVAGGVDAALNKAMGSQFTLKSDGGTYVAPVPEMKKLVDQGKAAFVWLYANGHGSGEMATRALYCANEKGKFWQVHDLLMSDKGYEILNGSDVKGQAVSGPVVKNDKSKSGDLANFLKPAMSYNDMKDCLEGGKYDSRLTDDMAIATQFGFSGTPDFFVNTTNYIGAYSWTDMKTAVDVALK